MKTLIKPAALLALNLLALTAARAQNFQVVDLTPDGMSGSLQAIAGGQQAGSVDGFPGGVVAATASHAFVWNFGAPVDLHPSFMDFSQLNAPGNTFVASTDGVNQVGYGFGAATFQRRVALRWNGTADSASVLDAPFQHLDSKALGTCNGQAVGYAITVSAVNGRGTVRQAGGPWHAVLWDFASNSAQDLNNGSEATVATACDSGRQVGYGGKMDISGNVVENKAMMWMGNRSNFVWLHPSGWVESQAVAIAGSYQAGWGSVPVTVLGVKTTSKHALLWTGSAAAFKELAMPVNIPFFGNFFATGVSVTGATVGYTSDNNNVFYALYWATPASAAVNLNQFLPAGFTSATASGIDSLGRIVGSAVSGGVTHAIMWVPVQ